MEPTTNPLAEEDKPVFETAMDKYKEESALSYKKHVADQIRKVYPELVKAKFDDDKSIEALRRLEAPDSDPVIFNKALEKMYKPTWKPPKAPSWLAQKASQAGAMVGNFVNENVVQPVAALPKAFAEGAQGVQKIAEAASLTQKPGFGGFPTTMVNEQGQPSPVGIPQESVQKLDESKQMFEKMGAHVNRAGAFAAAYLGSEGVVGLGEKLLPIEKLGTSFIPRLAKNARNAYLGLPTFTGTYEGIKKAGEPEASPADIWNAFAQGVQSGAQQAPYWAVGGTVVGSVIKRATALGASIKEARTLNEAKRNMAKTVSIPDLYVHNAAESADPRKYLVDFMTQLHGADVVNSTQGQNMVNHMLKFVEKYRADLKTSIEDDHGITPSSIEHPFDQEDITTPGIKVTQPEVKVPGINAPSAPQTTLTLPKELSGAKPKYGYGQKLFDVQFQSDIDKALYITAQKTKSKSDAAYRDWLKTNAGFTDKEIDERGPIIRDIIKSFAKTGDPETGPIVVNSTIMGKYPTVRTLEKFKDSNLTSREKVRRVLGTDVKIDTGDPNRNWTITDHDEKVDKTILKQIASNPDYYPLIKTLQNNHDQISSILVKERHPEYGNVKFAGFETMKTLGVNYGHKTSGFSEDYIVLNPWQALKSIMDVAVQRGDPLSKEQAAKKLAWKLLRTQDHEFVHWFFGHGKEEAKFQGEYNEVMEHLGEISPKLANQIYLELKANDYKLLDTLTGDRHAIERGRTSRSSSSGAGSERPPMGEVPPDPSEKGGSKPEEIVSKSSETSPEPGSTTPAGEGNFPVRNHPQVATKLKTGEIITDPKLVTHGQLPTENVESHGFIINGQYYPEDHPFVDKWFNDKLTRGGPQERKVEGSSPEKIEWNKSLAGTPKPGEKPSSRVKFGLDPIQIHFIRMLETSPFFRDALSKLGGGRTIGHEELLGRAMNMPSMSIDELASWSEGKPVSALDTVRGMITATHWLDEALTATTGNDLEKANEAWKNVQKVWPGFNNLTAEGPRATEVQKLFQFAKRVNDKIGELRELNAPPEQFRKEMKKFMKAERLDMVPSTWDYVKDAMTRIEDYATASKLTSPMTHAVNTISNGLTFTHRAIERYASAAQLAAQGDKVKAQAMAKYAWGSAQGFADATAKLVDEIAVSMDALKGKELEPWQKEQLQAYEFLTGKGDKAPKNLDWGFHVPQQIKAVSVFRGLYVADQFWKSMIIDSELKTKAYIQAFENEHLTGDEAAARIKELSENAPKAWKEEADTVAREYTFQEAPDRALEILHKLQNFGPMRLIIPFITTPYNITKFYARRSVFAFPFNIASKSFRREIEAGGIRRAQAISKMMVGLGFTLGSTALLKLGQITGAYPTDKNEQQYWKERQIRPWSVNVFGKWISYNRFLPAGAYFMTVAAINDAFQNKQFDKGHNKLGKLLTEFAKGPLDLPFLQGMNSIFELTSGIQGGSPEVVGSTFQKIYRNAVSGLFPNLMRDINQQLDPTQRQATNLKEAIMLMLPGMSSSVQPRITPLGEEAKQIDNRVLRATKMVSNDEKTPETDVMNQLGWAPPKVELNLKVTLPTGEEHSKRLDGKEATQYQKDMGIAAKFVLDTLPQKEGWSKATDYQKKSYLTKYTSRIRRAIRIYYESINGLYGDKQEAEAKILQLQGTDPMTRINKMVEKYGEQNDDQSE